MSKAYAKVEEKKICKKTRKNGLQTMVLESESKHDWPEVVFIFKHARISGDIKRTWYAKAWWRSCPKGLCCSQCCGCLLSWFTWPFPKLFVPTTIYMTTYLNMDVNFAVLIKSYAPLTFTPYSILGFIVLSSSYFFKGFSWRLLFNFHPALTCYPFFWLIWVKWSECSWDEWQ